MKLLLVYFFLAFSVSSYGFVLPKTSTPRIHSARVLAHGWPTNVPSFGSSTRLAATPVEAPVSNSLLVYFLETLIANSVPAFFAIIVIAFAAMAFRPKKDKDTDYFLKSSNPAAALYNDLYGDQQQQQDDGSGKLRKFFGASRGDQLTLPKNTGVPEKQYLSVKYLNRKLESYQYSLEAATTSKAKAAAEFRQVSFERALGKSVAALPPSVLQELQTTEKGFLKDGAKLMAEIQSLQGKLTQAVIDEELQALGMENVYQLDPKTNATNVKIQKNKFNKKGTLQALSKAQREMQQLELSFIKDVVKVVGSTNGAAVRSALLGDIAARGSGGLLSALHERPLTSLLSTSSERQKPALYVTRFPGDVTASQVSDLREEVTAITRSSRPGDEALIVLQSGGGTVTGYGLAAGQLLRLKDAGLRLTVAVEQVAASGGYMMCCVADHIVASPFAVLGSIGVITDIPNVYERLKKEGIEFQTVTAGKFKRTLTPTKRVTTEDFEKTKQDVEQIFQLFRQFVAQNRPQLDIDNVATGETWFGVDALERKLCDELKTVDAVLLDYVDKGFDVYEVDYAPPPEIGGSLGRLLPTSEASSNEGLVTRCIRWIVRNVAKEIKAEFDIASANEPIEERYKAVDDTANKIKLQG